MISKDLLRKAFDAGQLRQLSFSPNFVEHPSFDEWYAVNKPEYRIDHAHRDIEFIEKQHTSILAFNTCTCRCSETEMGPFSRYRCLYCEEWFCTKCAEEHFGITVKEWKDANSR